MKLTVDTLKNFWIWYLLPEQRKRYKTSSLIGGNNVAKIRFLAMSFPERYGVYVDFFDSVEIRISMNQFNKEYWFDIDPQAEDCECLKTRTEARIAAIEKANEIYNNI